MLKRIKFISGLCLGFVLLITLTACAISAFPKVKESFEDAGWTYSQELADEYKLYDESHEGDEERFVTIHVFKKGLVNFAIVYEFTSTKKLDEALENSATLRGILEDAQKSDLVYKNCFLLPIGITVSAQDMINTFQGNTKTK